MITSLRRSSLRPLSIILSLFLLGFQMCMPLLAFAQPTTLAPETSTTKVCKIGFMKWVGKGTLHPENNSDFMGGVHKTGWFAQDATRRVALFLSTQNCAGNTLSVSVVQRDTGDPDKPTQINDFKVPLESDSATPNIGMLTGEEACTPLTENEVVRFTGEMAQYLKNNKDEIAQHLYNYGTPLGSGVTRVGDEQRIYTPDADYQLLINTLDTWANNVDEANDGWEAGNSIGAISLFAIPVYGLFLGTANLIYDFFYTQESGTYANYVETLHYIAKKDSNQKMENFANIVDEIIERENASGRLIMPAPCDHVAKVKIIDPTGAVVVPETISNRIAYQCSDDENFDMSGNCADGYGRGQYWSITEVGMSDFSSLINPESPCYDPNIGAYRLGCVELISPLPGFGNTIDSNLNLGRFINIVVMVMIGLIGLLAVVRLVQLGVEYFTSDSVNIKQTAKSNIWMLVWAIAIASGVFVIFNTINPYILELNFSVSPVNLQTLEGDMGFVNDRYSDSGPSPKSCPEGIVVSSGFDVCATYKANIDGLVAAAKADGIILTGGGFRSFDEQVKLRKANCGPTDFDIFKKPSSRCRPQTAIPGTSMHESGYALDLQCTYPAAGITKPTLINWDNQHTKDRPWDPKTKACFDWLQANAGKFGYKNWSKENWHFSKNGR